MSTEKETSSPAAAPKGEAPASRVRSVVACLAVIVTLGAVAFAGRWAFYRVGHIVVDDAATKGTISKIGARIDGQITSILVEPGQRVSKGQVLVQLEDRYLRASLSQAEAALESATNELRSETISIQEDRHRLTMDMERAQSLVKAAAATLEGAQSTLDRLNSEFKRISELAKQGISSQSDLDLLTGQRGAAQAAVKSDTEMREAAQSALESAKAQLDALCVREAHLGVLRAQVAMAQANVSLAQANVAATTLNAPDDGWIIERIVETGGSAKVGEEMLSLWTGNPWIEAWASEKDLQRIRIGSQAQVSLDAYPGQLLSGRVEAIGCVSDRELTNHVVPSALGSLVRKTAYVPIRIAVPSGGLSLQPGLSAVVGIVKQSPHGLVQVDSPTCRFRAPIPSSASSGMMARGEPKISVNSQP
jgi:multidrug resistance efflux pump